jgi:hypothetical protein
MASRQVINQLNTLALRDDIPSDARKEIEKSVEDLVSPLKYDVWIYRAVVSILGALTIIAALGAVWAGVAGKEVPESLVALGATAVGALAGLLAPSPNNG